MFGKNPQSSEDVEGSVCDDDRRQQSDAPELGAEPTQTRGASKSTAHTIVDKTPEAVFAALQA